MSNLVTAEEIQSILIEHHASEKLANVNDVFFTPGDPCKDYIYLKAGTVRVELLSATGHQFLLYRIQEGQYCVMTTACLLGNESYSAQAVAESPVSVLVLQQSAFNRLLLDSAAFREFVFTGFSARLSNLMFRVNELATSTVDQRIAAALVANSPSDSSFLEFTHEQLAIDAGTAREVVTRRLAVFEKRGWLRRHRGRIEITKPDSIRSILSS